MNGLRWDPYILKGGNHFDDFWGEYLRLEKRDVLYVLGKGFDPRMCNGIERLYNLSGEGKRDCLLIEFVEGPESPSRQYQPLVQANADKLHGLITKKGEIHTETIQMWKDDGIRKRRIGSYSAGNVMNAIKIDGYSDIVIDISAMPQSIYFPLIGSCLSLIDQNKNCKINIHIIVCENVELDKGIEDNGIDDKAYYIHGFSGGMENEATEGIPKIWIPILGEGSTPKLEKIYNFVSPDEICPVLPSPSKNPRQGDDILLGYRELIFDQWRIETRNIIYSSEQNPFEAYRQICRTVDHYERALETLGGCKFAVTSVSSKLISLGALLAAYELKKRGKSIGLAYVEAQGYEMRLNNHEFEANNELFTLCLPYDY